MLNFAKLADIIPLQGQITFTIRKADSDKLLVLLNPIFPEIKDLSGEKKELYERARRPLSIKGTPAELNEKFFGLLEQTYEDEGRLHRALSERREAGNQLIEKVQKEKAEAKNTHDVTPPEGEAASEEESAATTTPVTSPEEHTPQPGGAFSSEKAPATFNLFG